MEEKIVIAVNRHKFRRFKCGIIQAERQKDGEKERC